MVDRDPACLARAHARSARALRRRGLVGVARRPPRVPRIRTITWCPTTGRRTCCSTGWRARRTAGSTARPVAAPRHAVRGRDRRRRPRALVRDLALPADLHRARALPAHARSARLEPRGRPVGRRDPARRSTATSSSAACISSTASAPSRCGEILARARPAARGRGDPHVPRLDRQPLPRSRDAAHGGLERNGPCRRRRSAWDRARAATVSAVATSSSTTHPAAHRVGARTPGTERPSPRVGPRDDGDDRQAVPECVPHVVPSRTAARGPAPRGTYPSLASSRACARPVRISPGGDRAR